MVEQELLHITTMLKQKHLILQFQKKQDIHLQDGLEAMETMFKTE